VVPATDLEVLQRVKSNLEARPRQELDMAVMAAPEEVPVEVVLAHRQSH
jgi:hypothetical protein